MKVLFVAGFGPIAADVKASRNLYQDALALPFEEDGDYLHTQVVEGVTRLLGPEGMLVGVTVTPWMRS